MGSRTKKEVKNTKNRSLNWWKGQRKDTTPKKERGWRLTGGKRRRGGLAGRKRQSGRKHGVGSGQGKGGARLNDWAGGLH